MKKQPTRARAQAQAHADTCPHCGYCPHCGRSASPYRPFYWWYWQPIYTPMPIWGGAPTTSTVGSGPTLTTSGYVSTGSAALVGTTTYTT
jgi:hypothetical protein